MDKSKAVRTPLLGHFKLSIKQCLSTEEEKKSMDKVSYASEVSSLMYAMVCTRPDIGHAIGVVSRFLLNPRREYWEAVKWILRYLWGAFNMRLCFRNDKCFLKATLFKYGWRC